MADEHAETTISVQSSGNEPTPPASGPTGDPADIGKTVGESIQQSMSQATDLQLTDRIARIEERFGQVDGKVDQVTNQQNQLQESVGGLQGGLSRLVDAISNFGQPETPDPSTPESFGGDLGAGNQPPSETPPPDETPQSKEFWLYKALRG